jgi:hypothetical protein
MVPRISYVVTVLEALTNNREYPKCKAVVLEVDSIGERAHTAVGPRASVVGAIGTKR